MPVIETRPPMISSISANEDAIKPKDLFDGWPGFFGASEGVGVGDQGMAATTGGEDVDVDVTCVETRGMEGSRVGLSGPPVGSTTVGLAVGTGAGCSGGLSSALARSSTVVLDAGGGAGGRVGDTLLALADSGVLWSGAEGDRDGLSSPPAGLGMLGWAVRGDREGIWLAPL
jgi:hypothetical protein